MSNKRGHKLMTKELIEKMPALYSQEEKGLDAVAQVKFFSPYSGWTWYATEFDGEDIFFGYVEGFDGELGTFSLAELDSVTVKFLGVEVPAVERDLYWTPRPLKELVA